ncbi:MAG: polymer-forming cytoskeletal protein, partial [Rubrivivax sp.]|nr:polymer-forming cytoskeletal protein [Rubrivivax sp.]
MWFGKRKQPPIRSLIGEGLLIRGEVRFSDGMRIDGEVHGDVIADSNSRSLLVIGENARIHGKVRASHVIISGEVTGPVWSGELLEL